MTENYEVATAVTVRVVGRSTSTAARSEIVGIRLIGLTNGQQVVKKRETKFLLFRPRR